MITFKDFGPKIVEILKKGGVGVVPTDTIYGISASALDKKAVERVYSLKGKAEQKPMIVLISSPKDLDILDVRLNTVAKKFLKTYWPGRVSVILDCLAKKYEYLHRGTKTLAFRVPAYPDLISLLKKTGPLVSTSANPGGKEPAGNIAQAKKYFGEKMDFYVDIGDLGSTPSTVARIYENGNVEIIREGSVKIK